MASKATKIFTGLTGLPVSAEPHRELLRQYNKLSRALKRLPESYKYRTVNEEMIKQRTEIIQTTPDRDDVERKIGAGLFEEMIEQAKHETILAQTMEEYKAWEKIEEIPDEKQWKWPQ